MLPRVSIIIPVYNCEKYIKKCLESIMKQTYENIEIILINDGSKDQSEKVIFETIGTDNRVRYILQNNKGPSSARNKGIELADGEYLAFLDGDDSVDENYIRILLESMESSQVDLVCCGYRETTINGGYNHTDFGGSLLTNKQEIMKAVCQGTGGVLWGKLFKLNIVRSHKIYMDRDIFMSEDLLFVLNYVKHCDSLLGINSYLYNYNRLNEKSISSKFSVEYVYNNIRMCERIEEVFRSSNIPSSLIREIVSTIIFNSLLSYIAHLLYMDSKWKIIKLKVRLYEIIHIPYVLNSLVFFNTNKTVNKPYIFMFKYKLLSMAILYSLLLDLIRKYR